MSMIEHMFNPLLLFCSEILAALGTVANSKTYGLWFNPCSSDNILSTMVKYLLPQCLDNLQQISFNECLIYEQLLINSCYCIAMLPRKLYSILVSLFY